MFPYTRTQRILLKRIEDIINRYHLIIKCISSILLGVFLLQFGAPFVLAGNSNEFVSYAEKLEKVGMFRLDDPRELLHPLSQSEATKIGVNISGGATGVCTGYIPTDPSIQNLCKYYNIALERGFAIENFRPLAFLSRVDALVLLARASGLSGVSAPSGFRDVDNTLSETQVRYVSQARELGCIQSVKYFSPYTLISRGEAVKMVSCFLESTQQEGIQFLSAPETSNTSPYPTAPLTAYQAFTANLPTGTNASTTIIQSLSNVVGDSTIGGNLTVSGVITMPQLLISNPIGIPVELMGRTASGYLAPVGLGSGVSLQDGYISLSSSGTYTVTSINALAGGFIADADFQSGATNFQSNVSILGNLVSDSLSTLRNLRILDTTGIPTALLGRDGSGSVSSLTLTPTLSLSGGVLGVVQSSLALVSDQITEGTNLYFTNARARNALSVTGSLLNYNATTGVLGFSATTSDISEGSNLYYTQGRFDTAFGLKTTTDLTEGSNLYYTDTRADTRVNTLFPSLFSPAFTGAFNSGFTPAFNSAFSTSFSPAFSTSFNSSFSPAFTGAFNSLFPSSFDTRFDTRLGLKTTADLTEGSNLYYTQGRFDTAFGLKSTSDLSEGSNLYFTDIRAQNALSGVVIGIQSSINSLSGTVNTLGASIDTLSGTISSLSGDLALSRNAMSTLSGTVTTLIGQYNSLSGSIYSLSSTVDTLSGTSLIHTSQISTLSGTVDFLGTNIASLSGNISTLTANIINLTAELTSLSGTVSGVRSEMSTLSGNLAGVVSDVLSLSGTVAGLVALSHSPLTLGIANGLTLSGQELSLNLASSTTVGALSAADWNTFNNKINLSSLSATGGIGYNSTTGEFSDLLTFTDGVVRSGNTVRISGMTGGQLSGFTDRNILFGSPTGGLTSSNQLIWDESLGGRMSIGGAYPERKLRVTATDTNDGLVVDNLSNRIMILPGTTIFNGAYNPIARQGDSMIVFSSGAMDQGALTIAPWANTMGGMRILADGSIGIGTPTPTAKLDIVGTIRIADGTEGSGKILMSDSTGLASWGTLGFASTTSTGLLTSTDWNTFNTKENPLTFGNGLTRVGNSIGLINGISDGQVLTMSGGAPVWLTPGAISIPVNSVFGRTGTVIAQSGDYSTDQITEGTNLYFTNARARNALSVTGSLLNYNATTGVLGFSATTSDISEGSNLYFTEIRAQNALSGVVIGIQSSINSLSGTVNTLGASIDTLSGTISSLSGDLAVSRGTMTSLSGTVDLLMTQYNFLSGSLSSLSSTVDTLSGTSQIHTSQIASLSGVVSTLDTTLSTLSGNIATVTTNVSDLASELTSLSGTVAGVRSDITTLSGSLNTLSSNVLTLSGTLATLSALSHAPLTLGIANGLTLSGQELSLNLSSSTTVGALSAADWNTFNTKENPLTFGTGLTRVGNSIGLLGGSNGQVLTMSGGAPVWLTPGAISIPVNSVFGRTGAIIAQIGDYSTDQITEGTNLYYTQGRFDTAFGLKSTADLSEGTNLYFTNARARSAISITGSLLNYNATTGIIGFTGTTSNLTEGSNLYYTDARARSALSISGPLTYNNLTGVFGIVNANTTTTGALSATDWNTFNNKLGSLNGLTGVSQTFGIGTTGTDFTISSLGTTHTFNLPDAGSLARGLVSTGSQTFAGQKTFSVAPIFTGFTPGSLFFAGAGGVLSENNALAYWDNSNNRLGIGTNAPDTRFEVRGLNVATPNNSGAITNAIFRMRGSTNHALDFGTFSNAPFGSWIQSVDHTNLATGLALALNPVGGNVGIGIIAPTARLHVQDNTITTGDLVSLVSTGLTTGNALKITGGSGRTLFRVAQNGSDPLDIERVTIGEGGVSAAKPDSLARDQLYVFGRINSSWNAMAEDFMVRSANAIVTNDATFNNNLYFDDANGGGAAAGWQVDVVTSAGISGIARLSTQTTGANFNARLMTSTNVTQRSLNPVFEARVLGTATANHRIQVGFANTVVGSTWTADNTYGGQTDGIFFRKNAAAGVWSTVTRAGGVETVNNTTMSTNAYRTLRIEVNNTLGNAAFYIDGALQFTHTTNVPAAATALGYGIGTSMSAATAGLTVDIDYIRVWSDDPPTVTDTPEPGEEGYVSDLFSNVVGVTQVEDTLDFITARTVITTFSSLIDATGSGILDVTKPLSGDNTMDLEETGTYLVLLVKRIIERLSEVWFEMTLFVRSIRTEEIVTDKLCVGQSCITEQELTELMEMRSQTSSSSSSYSSSSSSSPPPPPPSTSSGAIPVSEDTTPESSSEETSSESSSEETPPSSDGSTESSAVSSEVVF